MMTDTEAPKGRSHTARNLGLVFVAVIVLDVLAMIIAPPFPKGGATGEACAYPVCFIGGNLEFPPPTTVIDLDPANPLPTGPLVLGFHPSITSTILTMWIVELVVLALFLVATRRLDDIPRGLQNLVEWGYELLEDFATSVGGTEAVKHIPVYAGFFILILFMNWSGLVPPVGKIEQLRAPTSDVNITIGLALAAFAYFEYQGFRSNGVLGYLGKFFPIYEFRSGIGAGLIAMFVGLIELLLEFVKPVTLAMRLFGNIYGGEVALAVMTALLIGILPVALYFLELILNFAQALIFSVLTLMFTLIAVESHHGEEGELGHEAMEAVQDAEQHEAARAAA
ncbi:MAG TPA: FoF1 ATP synthase subunit a [Candidatus Limnocylindrales bacterium]